MSILGTTREIPLQSVWACRWELDVQRVQLEFWVRFMCLIQCFISCKMFIRYASFKDRLLSSQWHQLRMPSLQNWSSIDSHSSVPATQINTSYLADLSGTDSTTTVSGRYFFPFLHLSSTNSQWALTLNLKVTASIDISTTASRHH